MEPYKAAIEAEFQARTDRHSQQVDAGLIALMEGRAHMAMISASLNSEVEQIKKVMPGLAYDRLQVHSIVSTRIAIAIHPSNPVRKASLNQVRKILLGQISNWSELGGKDQPIRVVLVGGGGGVTTVIESELLNGKLPEGPHIIYVKTPVQLVQVIEQEPGALGFAQLALTKQRGLPEIDHRDADRADPEPRHLWRSDAGDEGGHRCRAPGRREGDVASDGAAAGK